MKIAFILYPDVIISNRSNGIRSQAEMWAKELSNLGHDVALVNTWGNYNWKDFDVIHFFKGGAWMPKLAKKISEINPNIIWSPIIDPYQNLSFNDKLKEVLVKIISCGLFRTNVYYERINSRLVKAIIVRTNYEKCYVNEYLNFSKEKTHIIHLCCSPYVRYDIDSSFVKEDFCLHISSIYQKRKNVINLVKAAKKYGFNLVLAGNKGTCEQFSFLEHEIDNAPNIKVLGFVSEDEKIDLYRRAKVFALPSTNEGVGIVALDAAFYGCEIVITNIEGPKEYYDSKCKEVDPHDVDQIGKAIVGFLKGEYIFQPMLKKYLSSKYTPEITMKELIDVYERVRNQEIINNT